jgi:hypothetical protein
MLMHLLMIDSSKSRRE